MSLKPTDSLIQRFLVGGIAVLLFLLVVYLANAPLFGWVFLGLLTVIIGMALWEFYEMTVVMQFRPMIRTGIWGAALYLLACWGYITYPNDAFLTGTVLLFLLLLAFGLQLTGKVDNPLPNLAVTIFGFVYLVLPLACILLITYYPFEIAGHDGRWWLFYLVLVTKMTDIGGFVAGKSFGTRPLAPRVSPKKTVEGAIGGLLFATLASIVIAGTAQLAALPGPLGLSIWGSFFMGVILCVAAQLGDLAESLLKRNAGVKDSSHLPGLGGVLDIMDSMVFTAPIVYLYLSAVAVKL